MKLLAVSWGSVDRTPVLQRAATLSKEMGAELHVAHIWNFQPSYAPEFIDSTHCKRQDEDSLQLMETAIQTIEAEGGFVAETHVRPGFPENEAIKLSEELEADMLLVSKQKQGIIKRLLVGCEAERIARHSSCPVVLVEQGTP